MEQIAGEGAAEASEEAPAKPVPAIFILQTSESAGESSAAHRFTTVIERHALWVSAEPTCDDESL